MEIILSQEAYSQIPMVKCLLDKGIKPDLAEYTFESLLRKNPYYALLNMPVNESLFDSNEDPFFDTFLEAYVMTEGNINLMIEACYQSDPNYVIEGIVDTAAEKAKAAGNAISNGASQAKRTVERTANDVKHMVNPIVAGIHKTIVGYQQQSEEEKRQMIISGSIFYKMRYLFKKILHLWFTKTVIFTLVPGGFLGLILAIPKYLVGLFLLTKAAYTTGKVVVGGNMGDIEPKTKNRVIQELELELKMCREKIEDARSAGDKEKKYQLMRIENKIEQEILRVKYNATI